MPTGLLVLKLNVCLWGNGPLEYFDCERWTIWEIFDSFAMNWIVFIGWAWLLLFVLSFVTFFTERLLIPFQRVWCEILFFWKLKMGSVCCELTALCFTKMIEADSSLRHMFFRLLSLRLTEWRTASQVYCWCSRSFLSGNEMNVLDLQFAVIWWTYRLIIEFLRITEKFASGVWYRYFVISSTRRHLCVLNDSGLIRHADIYLCVGW